MQIHAKNLQNEEDNQGNPVGRSSLKFCLGCGVFTEVDVDNKQGQYHFDELPDGSLLFCPLCVFDRPSWQADPTSLSDDFEQCQVLRFISCGLGQVLIAARYGESN